MFPILVNICENISDIGEIFENISDIGENVPVADFGHYADYSAPLIPLSLLKSSLGGGGSAAHMWHCTKLPTQYYSTTAVLWYSLWWLFGIAHHHHSTIHYSVKPG